MNRGADRLSRGANRHDGLLRAVLEPFFGPLPAGLGREIFSKIQKLVGIGRLGSDHAEDIFSIVLTKAYLFLERNGEASVRNLRAWFHEICRHEVSHYLAEMRKHSGSEEALSEETLSVVLNGEVGYWDANLGSPERMWALTREALQTLPPRYRELIEVDLLELLSPAEIEKRMQIRSHRYFIKLKSKAFAALTAAMRALVEKGIGCVY